MFINIHPLFQLMINIEITNSIQKCIIFTNDTHLFHKKFIDWILTVMNLQHEIDASLLRLLWIEGRSWHYPTPIALQSCSFKISINVQKSIQGKMQSKVIDDCWKQVERKAICSIRLLKSPAESRNWEW